MDRYFIVPIILGDENMLIELSAKGFFIPAVIDALLKFSDESGC
jgi:hypothetical protein